MAESIEELSPRAQAKRRQITDAARRLFLSQGFARTSMDAITAEAGVSKQTLYAYFPSKDDLLLAIVAEALQALGPQHGVRAPRTRAELRAALIGFGERMLDTWCEVQFERDADGIDAGDREGVLLRVPERQVEARRFKGLPGT